MLPDQPFQWFFSAVVNVAQTIYWLADPYTDPGTGIQILVITSGSSVGFSYIFLYIFHGEETLAVLS